MQIRNAVPHFTGVEMFRTHVEAKRHARGLSESYVLVELPSGDGLVFNNQQGNHVEPAIEIRDWYAESLVLARKLGLELTAIHIAAQNLFMALAEKAIGDKALWRAARVYQAADALLIGVHPLDK